MLSCPAPGGGALGAGMSGMDKGPDLMAGIGVVGVLVIAGKGVLAGSGGNGIVRTGCSGSVLTRCRRLCVSAGLDCGADGAFEAPVVFACAAPGGVLAD